MSRFSVIALTLIASFKLASVARAEGPCDRFKDNPTQFGECMRGVNQTYPQYNSYNGGTTNVDQDQLNNQIKDCKDIQCAALAFTSSGVGQDPNGSGKVKTALEKANFNKNVEPEKQKAVSDAVQNANGIDLKKCNADGVVADEVCSALGDEPASKTQKYGTTALQIATGLLPVVAPDSPGATALLGAGASQAGAEMFGGKTKACKEKMQLCLDSCRDTVTKLRNYDRIFENCSSAIDPGYWLIEQFVKECRNVPRYRDIYSNAQTQRNECDTFRKIVEKADKTSDELQQAAMQSALSAAQTMLTKQPKLERGSEYSATQPKYDEKKQYGSQGIAFDPGSNGYGGKKFNPEAGLPPEETDPAAGLASSGSVAAGTGGAGANLGGGPVGALGSSDNRPEVKDKLNTNTLKGFSSAPNVVQMGFNSYGGAGENPAGKHEKFGGFEPGKYDLKDYMPGGEGERNLAGLNSYLSAQGVDPMTSNIFDQVKRGYHSACSLNRLYCNEEPPKTDDM